MSVETRSIGRFIEMGMKLIAIWPGKSLQAVRQLTWLVTLIIAQIFQYRYIVVHFVEEDLYEMTECISITLSYSLITLKLLMVWMKDRAFRDILEAMRDDWSECNATDWRIRLMVENADFSRRCSKYIISTYWVAVLFFATGITATEGGDGERQLLLKMELPFDSKTSPIYEIVLAVQMIQHIMVVTVEGTLNAFMVTLILHTSSRIDIMRRQLSEIPYKDGVACEVMVKDLIYRHHNVIRFTENIEAIYSYPALVQFASNIALICLLGFVIVESFDTGQGLAAIARFLPFYAAANVNAFVYCFSGEYLTFKSESIGVATYDSCWYNMEPKVSRGLLLLILRSQRRLTITVGKFMDLSHTCFATMLKASASYMSVLHAMN